MEAYSVAYYQELNREEEAQARALAEAMIDLYHPQSVTDLGCATGLYLQPFKCRVSGFDISPQAFDEKVLRIPAEDCHIADLRDGGFSPLKAGVALCLEVVEHIGCEHADTLVSNICKASDILVITAAPPGQAGLNHVNCQPMSYWEEKFGKHGFKRDYHDEFQLAFRVWQTPHTLWIVRNLMVFRR